MSSLRSRAGESFGAFADVARNPGLRRLAFALTGSELGSWGYSVALSVLVFDSGGANALGVLALVLFIPPGIAAPFTSILGDRFHRLRVMVGSDLVRAGLWGLAALVAFSGWSIGLLYVIAALSGIARTAFRPAQAAALPSLARTPQELTAANVVSSTIESVTTFAGPALGGVIVAVTQPGVAFLVASGSFVWSALLVSSVRLVTTVGGEPAFDAHESTSIARTLTAGVEAIVREPSARVLLTTVGAQTLVSGTLVVFVPLLALGPIGIGERGLGTLWSALGVGGVVGAFATAALVGRKRQSGPFAVGTLLWGAPILLLAIWQTHLGALVLLGVIGLGNTVVDVASTTLLQRAVRDAVLARVFGILESIIYLTHAIGGIAAALLVGAFGVRSALIVSGAFLPVVVAVAWRRLRAIDVEAPPSTRALELLGSQQFLAALPPTTLESLAVHAVFVQLPAGRRVIEQGDHGDRFYVIADGTASVEVDGRHTNDLGPGDPFGEVALLRDVPRTATVIAQSELTLLAVDRDEFLAAVTGHAPTAEAAGALVEARLSRTLAGLVG